MLAVHPGSTPGFFRIIANPGENSKETAGKVALASYSPVQVRGICILGMLDVIPG